ncbi:MAG: metallophosphoesterase [Oscillospiraceae bacterium]|nr:metallophosphoesterase [Oscillospiraceae bacterium]
MLSFKNHFHQFMSKAITLVFTVFFGTTAIFSGVHEKPPVTPEDFTPVLRFAVCSDIHISSDENGQKNSERFSRLFDRAYAYAEGEAYGNLDALAVCGDMTERGKAEEYAAFMEIVNKKLQSSTAFLPCIGNHEFIEYRDHDASKAYDVYREYVGTEMDIHTVIGGYHFIVVSYDPVSDETYKGKVTWLREQLELAQADTGDKPIFVFQHAHPTLTVYGSINWGEVDIRNVLNAYPQAVDFSGHSHYAANDPRSLWQGAFTAVGCGAVTGAMGNLSYISGDAYGDGESATFWIVEVDADGNVRLRLYDLISDQFFPENDCYLSDLGNRTARTYTWLNMYSLDTAPVFPEKAVMTAEKNSDGETILSFPEARSYFPAENYKISVTAGIRTVYSDTVLSDYTRADDKEKEINLGVLAPGEYKVSVKAFSPYAKGGETLSAIITAD